MDNKIWLVAILAVIGLFYVAAPHSVHISSGLGFGWTHTMHIMFGVVLFIIAGILYFSYKKPKKAAPAAKKRRKR